VTSSITDVSTTPPPALLETLGRARGEALMLGHVHPDGDVLGTLLGLGLSLETHGWSVTFAGPHPVPDTLKFLPGASRWQVWDAARGVFDVLVLTDCPNDARTEGLLEGARGATSQVLNIDHHPDNRRYGTLNWIDATAAATGEMVFDLIRALGHQLTPEIALNLFTALHTDTGSFRYSNTTARSFRIAAELTAAGADPGLVSDQLYQRRPHDALTVLGEVLRRVELSADGRVAWLTVPHGLVSDAFLVAEDLVTYPRSIEGVEVAILLREEADGQVKCSLRGKGRIPVNAIAQRFGGGGHANAAGCTMRGSLEEATGAVLAFVDQALRGKSL
jgi:phosphoesterase RecJ-like protein